jgi:hypothetical protein
VLLAFNLALKMHVEVGKVMFRGPSVSATFMRCCPRPPLLHRVVMQLLGASFPQLNETGPMPKTKALMADMGATANNFYIHTPVRLHIPCPAAMG